MSNAVTRFLGDSPLRVAVKLIVFSIIAGVVMSTMGWTPRAIFRSVGDFFSGLWNLGFEAIYSSLEYFLLGAAVVVPVFFVIRLLNFRSPRA